MSWHYSQALVGEFSEANSLAGERSASWKSNPTHEVFSSNARMTESLIHSLSGMTSKPSTESPGEDTSMSSAVGSPAKTSVAPGRVKALTEHEAAYGVKWHESFAKWDRDTSSWKTHQCSLFGGLESFSETWPRWGTMQSGVCSERVMPAHHTSGTESGSWPTPAARDGKGANSAEHCFVTGTGRKHMDQLPNAVAHGGTKTRQMYPTPRCFMHKDALTDRGKSNLGEVINEQEGMTKTGQLNPPWVEWLMGWPIGWTDLKPLVMDKFQQWLDSHGKP
jgi:hypothetical protein